jgi:hypothetical protein
MRVVIGNANALEAYIENGEMMYRQVPGERETTFLLTDTQPMAAFQTVVVGMAHMISPDSRPWWVESDSEVLTSLLLDHYGLPPTSSARPAMWGDGTTTAPKPEPKKKKGEDA